MAKRRAEKRIVDVKDIPPEVVGAVVLADLAQIEADAKTHLDPDAKRRILFAVGRLREIAQAELSPALAGKLSAITNILNE